MATFITSLSLSAQEQLGFHTDNYSGINSVLLNPAGHANTPFNWDINLVEGAFFIENNYFDLTPFRLLDVNDVTIDDFQYGPEVKDPAELPPGAIIQDFVDDGRKRYANIAGHVMGPSFFVRINESSTIGLTTNFRVAGSGAGITDNLSYYTYFDQPLFEGFQVDKFSLGFMSWGEIGLNYMHQVEVNGGDLAVGATLKYLNGYEGAFLYSDRDFLLTKLPGDTLSGNSVSFNYGYTSSNLDMETVSLQKNGSGVGIDLGFVYTAKDYGDGYLWKIGVSLLDVGKVTFNQNAKEHLTTSDDLVVLATEGFQNIENLEDFESKLGLFSDQVLGDSSLSYLDGEFSMWLPSAISVQADYQFTQNVFVNATFVQGIPLGGVGVRRGSLLGITPRFEHRWFGAALPLSIYNWQDARLGLAARVAFFSVGTSNLGSVFGRNTFTGTDIYFAVKLNPFDLNLGGGSRGGNKNRKRGRSTRGVKCYEF
ncbi:MAG: hypothetical protein DWQ02_14625 [Bacteroidetes bacterium]|nr:MAG: hypothetical protein DWQ02_14625 [Bacteroidota bacterium]